MVKEWFILIHKRKEGPFSTEQLKLDPRFTPDTLVWKVGFKEWVAARYVSELQEIFREKKPQGKKPNSFKTDVTKKLSGKEDALAIQYTPPYLNLWIFIIFCLIILFLYLLH